MTTANLPYSSTGYSQNAQGYYYTPSNPSVLYNAQGQIVSGNGAQTTSTSSTPYQAPASPNVSGLISQLQSQLKSGQITGTQAQNALAQSMIGAYQSNIGGQTTFTNSTAADAYRTAVDNAINQTFSNIGPVTLQGQNGTYDANGNFIKTSTTVNQSTTNGTGTTTNNNQAVGGTAPTGVSYAQALAGLTSSGLTGSALSGAIQDLKNAYGTSATTTSSTTNSTPTTPTGSVSYNQAISNLQSSGLTGTALTNAMSDLNNAYNSNGGTSGTVNGVNTGTSSSTDSSLDGTLTGTAQSLATSGSTLPPGLAITPALVSQFLQYAHQIVDPQTQQLISGEIANINNDLQNQQLQYNNSVAGDVQDYGTNLAHQDNTAGVNGLAMSPAAQRADENLTNSTNRTIQGLTSTAVTNASNSLQQGATAVGASNAGAFNLPTFAGGTVGTSGGQFGSYQPSSPAALNYNPSLYVAGTIPSSQAQALAGQQASYQSQYTTLAGAQPTRSINDIIPELSNLPSGYQLPSLS